MDITGHVWMCGKGATKQRVMGGNLAMEQKKDEQQSR
jgi:hypothetical protein